MQHGSTRTRSHGPEGHTHTREHAHRGTRRRQEHLQRAHQVTSGGRSPLARWTHHPERTGQGLQRGVGLSGRLSEFFKSFRWVATGPTHTGEQVVEEPGENPAPDCGLAGSTRPKGAGRVNPTLTKGGLLGLLIGFDEPLSGL